MKVPTQGQWEDWQVEQRLELLARLLGFPVFYVNWVCTNGTTPPPRSFHSVIERIAPLLGLKRRYIITEDVQHCKKETQSYKELTVLVPLIYETAIGTFVGMQSFVEYLVAQSLRTPIEDMSLPEAADEMTHWRCSSRCP